MGMQSTRHVAVGQFTDPQQAGEAVAALRNAGFTDITLLTPVDTESSDEPGDHSPGDPMRASRGLIAGAMVGGLGGGLAGLRALPIPTLGPFIAAGSVALGAGIGTLAAGLLGLGPPRPLRRLPSLVLVRTDERLRDAERIMREHDAHDVTYTQEPSPLAQAVP